MAENRDHNQGQMNPPNADARQQQQANRGPQGQNLNRGSGQKSDSSSHKEHQGGHTPMRHDTDEGANSG